MATCSNNPRIHGPHVESLLVLITQYHFDSYGWCGTIHNFSSLENQVLEVSATKGWGFCQRSCYTELHKIPLGGIERFKV